MKTIQVDSFILFVGQNEQDNDCLLHMAEPTDIWFHVEHMPSAHVLLQTNKQSIRTIPHKVITQCAYQCKIHSRAKTEKKCPIMYTPISQVILTNIKGQVQVQTYKTICV